MSSNKKRILKIITEEKRISTVEIITKCPDLWASSVKNALQKLKRDKIIKIVAKRKIKSIPMISPRNTCNIYELC